MDKLLWLIPIIWGFILFYVTLDYLLSKLQIWIANHEK